MAPSVLGISRDLEGAEYDVLKTLQKDLCYNESLDPYYSIHKDSIQEAKLRERFKNADLRTNEGGRIEDIGWLKPSVFRDTPIEELRRRLRSDGYLYLQGLLPSSAVNVVREEYFKHFRETGILDDDFTAKEGVFKECNDPLKYTGIGADFDESQKLWKQKILESHTLPKYLKFVEHEELRNAVRSLMDWQEEILLERTMIRSNVPGGLSTATHYDKLYLREGSDPFLTGWVPIGSCNAEGGGLIFLEDSIELGRRIEQDFNDCATKAGFSDAERISAFNANMMAGGAIAQDGNAFGRAHGKNRWLVADYHAGDVVFFDEYLIHASGKNQDAGRKIRLSTDLRFVDKYSDYDKRWRVLWSHGDGL